MYLHLLDTSMVWINTYAPVPMWSRGGVSDSHGSQHLPHHSFPSDSDMARCLVFGCMGFVIDLRGPGGNVGIVQRTLPCRVARLCTRVPCQLW
jgi:hypothetical protein